MLKKSIWILLILLSIIDIPNIKADGLSFGISCYVCRRIDAFAYKNIVYKDLLKSGSAGNNVSVNLSCGYRFGEPYNEKIELQSFLGLSVGKQELLWSEPNANFYGTMFFSSKHTSAFHNLGIDFGMNSKFRFYEFDDYFWATAKVGVIGSYLVSLNQYVAKKSDSEYPDIERYNREVNQRHVEIETVNTLKHTKRLNLGITAGLGLEIERTYIGVHAAFWFMDHLRNKKHMYSHIISYGKNQFDIGVCVEINFMKAIIMNSEEDEDN